MRMKHLAATLILVFSSSSPLLFASAEAELEANLADALRLKKGTTERVGDARKAVRAYAKSGHLDTKADIRADYTDYYLLKKPATLMGHTLVVLEEEYMIRNVGCCVSPGLGLTLKLAGSPAGLEEFAKNNGCKLATGVDPVADLKTVGIRSGLPKADYATLSCRERDAGS
jgi:hypothetical protein